MTFHRRVTLRCLVDDLSGWEEAADQAAVLELNRLMQLRVAEQIDDAAVMRQLRSMLHLSKLRHPLIRHFDGQFSSDGPEVLRESITAVSDRLWWKQKTSRWRGAAVQISKNDSEVWLGAAGLREEGSPDDFYAWFADECAGGSSAFLPSTADLELSKIDMALAEFSSWKAQAQMTLLVMARHAIDENSEERAEFRSPKNDLVAEVAVEVVTVEDAGESLSEVIISIHPRTRGPFYDLLIGIALRTLSEEPDSVRILPVGSPADDGLSFAADLTDRLIAESEEAMRGELNFPPGELRLGTVAHFTRREHVTEATILGIPVEAICGHWFVPRHDFAGKPVCPTCEEAVERLPE